MATDRPDTETIMDIEKQTLKHDCANAVRGVFMGLADVVPGVSGGTVALVLGIYERLVTAISHFDLTLCGHVRRGRWRKAASHVDLRFLVSLAFGIGVGFLLMTVAMNILLTTSHTRQLTFAAFFGLIVGSGILVARMIRTKSLRETGLCVVLALAGGVAAFWVTTLDATQAGTAAPSYPYLFLCGSIAICAMILPGISGAMISLVLGVYVFMTRIPRDLLHGENVASGLTSLVVFGSGCAISLILFSKLLRWLLNKHASKTMAVLCGLMFGALPKLWPFQTEIDAKHHTYEPFMPQVIEGGVIAVMAVALFATLLVLAVDRVANRRTIPLTEKRHKTSLDRDTELRGERAT